MEKCPICKGTGELAKPWGKHKNKVAERKDMAKLLINEGYSYRQVAEFMNYKSTNSITRFVK